MRRTLANIFLLFVDRLIAFCFGMAIVLLGFLALEGFAYINESYRWIEPRRLMLSIPKNYDSHLTEQAAKLFHAAPEEFSSANFCKSCGKNLEGSDSTERCYPVYSKSSCRSTVRQSHTGEVVYDVYYSMNRDGYRVTPKSKRSDFRGTVLFFGDSYIFGEGLQDNQTLPYYFGARRPYLNVENLGVPGSAPHELLHEIETETCWRCFATVQPGSVAVYTFLDFMMERILGPISAFDSQKVERILTQPHFKLSSSGDVVFQGTFKNSRPWLNSIYSFIANTRSFKLFLAFIPPVTDSDLLLTAKLFADLDLELRERFGVKKLIVALYPGYSAIYGPKLKSFLLALDVPVIDLSGIDLRRAANSSTLWIPGDGHPTPIMNYVYAGLLAEKMTEFLPDIAKEPAPSLGGNSNQEPPAKNDTH
jgi:hypothetical protein